MLLVYSLIVVLNLLSFVRCNSTSFHSVFEPSNSASDLPTPSYHSSKILESFNSNSDNGYSQKATSDSTQLLLKRFHSLSKNLADQDGARSLVGDVVKSVAEQFNLIESKPGSLVAPVDSFDDEQATLEIRKIIAENPQLAEEIAASGGDNGEPSRNYFRITDKVFSRVLLPEAFSSKSSARSKGTHCGQFIGCIEELPNFSALVRKTNVSTIFTVYTPKNPRSGLKIAYEPLTHYQLQDINVNETELGVRIRSISQRPLGPQPVGQHLHQHLHNQNQRSAGKQRQRNTGTSWRSAVKIAHSREYPFDLAAIEATGFRAASNTRIIIGGYFAKADEEWIEEVIRQWMILEPDSNAIKVSWPDSNRGLYHTAAYNSRIVGRQLSLFLHYLDQVFHIDLNKFHLVGHSLGAHIAGLVGADYEGKIARITGLDPAGPIFFELTTGMRLDPTDAKFVDVMHTNSGSLTKGSLGLSLPVGHVDYYCNGGSIQPGCFFASVTKSIMDPVERLACNHRRSYRYFIEIIKITIREMTNSPPRPALVRSNQTRVDSSVGPNDIMLSREDSEEATQGCSAPCDHMNSELAYLPSAFLFDVEPELLGSMMQPPNLVLLDKDSSELDLYPPTRRRIEFHLMNPDFPTDKRGTYFFRSRSESPYFGAKQYALTLKTDTVIKRKIAIAAKINQTLIAEAEVDEIPGSYTLIFAPNDMKLMQPTSDSQVSPPLQLMWRYRSFNLLLSQQNELHLSGLELSLLEVAPKFPRKTKKTYYREPPVPVVRYTSGQSDLGPAVSSARGASGGIGGISTSGGLLKGGFGGHLTLTRNQWHKFEAKPIVIIK